MLTTSPLILFTTLAPLATTRSHLAPDFPTIPALPSPLCAPAHPDPEAFLHYIEYTKQTHRDWTTETLPFLQAQIQEDEDQGWRDTCADARVQYHDCLYDVSQKTGLAIALAEEFWKFFGAECFRQSEDFVLEKAEVRRKAFNDVMEGYFAATGGYVDVCTLEEYDIYVQCERREDGAAEENREEL